MLLSRPLPKHVLGCGSFCKDVTCKLGKNTTQGLAGGGNQRGGWGTHRKPHQETKWLSQLLHRLRPQARAALAWEFG